MIISIVGGGATGITIWRHLAELAGSDRYRNTVTGIQIFDKSGFDGGVAYRTQSDHHLLNMKASKMSIRPGDAGEFLRWAWRKACNAAKTITCRERSIATISTPCAKRPSSNVAPPVFRLMSNMPR